MQGGAEEETVPTFNSALQQLPLEEFWLAGHQNSFPALNVQLGKKKTERKGTSILQPLPDTNIHLLKAPSISKDRPREQIKDILQIARYV